MMVNINGRPATADAKDRFEHFHTIIPLPQSISLATLSVLFINADESSSHLIEVQ